MSDNSKLLLTFTITIWLWPESVYMEVTESLFLPDEIEPSLKHFKFFRRKRTKLFRQFLSLPNANCQRIYALFLYFHFYSTGAIFSFSKTKRMDIQTYLYLTHLLKFEFTYKWEGDSFWDLNYWAKDFLLLLLLFISNVSYWNIFQYPPKVGSLLFFIL